MLSREEKSVLISIQPKWVDKIASGEKTIEVRKSCPKLEPPFKCYIYETTAKYETGLLGLKCTCQGSGKVIGEFICDGIQEYESEFWDDETFEAIGRVYYDMETGEREVFHFAHKLEDNYVCQKSGLSWEELRQYVGQGIKTFYVWHISNLKIYDKLKELSEFKTVCYEQHCKLFYDRDCDKNTCSFRTIKSPPRSWSYVKS